MSEFKKINVGIFRKKPAKTSPDILYWKKLGVPVFIKEFGPVDYIDFSPVEPHYFAVTSSVRVQVYSPFTRLLYKNLSRFQKSAYGGSFRQDGRLICAGGEENEVKLFDVSSKTLLRVFKGHTGAVHRCFFTIDNSHIVSFSDDQTVGYWDIPSEKQLLSFKEHTDYIRAGAVSPVSPDIILSGGYDGCVKMYDQRSQSVVLNLNHGAPVESVLFLPTGGIFLSAGGTEIKVWNALQGGKLLTQFHNHHKTVTCLRLASGGKQIFSGSLDRHVNIYDVATFKRLHTIDYANAVLSLGISANDETLAVGMVDGLVSVSRRETELKPTKREEKIRYFKHANDDVNEIVDVYIGGKDRDKLPVYNTWLKKFQFTKVYNYIFRRDVVNRRPHVTVAVLKEFVARRALHQLIGGGNPKTIVPLLRFIIRHLGDRRFTRVLLAVTSIFLDVYEDNINQCGIEAVILLNILAEKCAEEVKLTESLLMLEGAVKLLIAASDSGNSQIGVASASDASATTLTPSSSGKDFVVNLN